MNNSQMTARVGLFFLIGIALVWVTFEALNDGRVSGKKGYTLVATFKSVKQLKHSDEVRMAGVKVGAVEATRLNSSGKAEAVLRILPDVKISKTATASIAMAGLLGSNYIAIEFGNPEAGALADGEPIKTKETADISEVMSDLGSLGQDIRNALSSFTGSSGGPDGQGGLIQKLDRLVTENSTKLSSTVSNLEAITAQIRSGQGTVGKLVYDQTAYDQLVAAVEQFKGAATDARAFVTNTQTLIEQVKSGKGTLGTLIYDEASGENIKVVARNLRELSEKLNNPNSSFGQLITNDTLVRDAQSTLRKVDRAVDGMGDSAPISAVGAVAGQLF